MSGKKKNTPNGRYKIKWQFISIILPVTIAPFIIILALSAGSIFHHLEKNSRQFYLQLLQQVATNIEFVFEQHAMALADVTMMDNFRRLVSVPDFSSAAEEREIYRKVSEKSDIPEGGSIRRTVLSRINGSFYMIELNRWSYIENKPFISHTFTVRGERFNYNKLIRDPLVTRLDKDMNRISFGMLQPGTVKGFEADEKPAIVYPYWKPGEEDITVLLITILQKDFLSNFYRDLTKLHFGTLYLIDQQGSVISSNHPGEDDYYTWDDERVCYIKEDGDSQADPISGLTFKQYKLLNTDPEILNHPDVKQLIEMGNIPENIEDISATVTWNGIRYLAMYVTGINSQCNFVYFHPVQQVRSPIYSLFFMIGIASVLLALLLAGVSILMANVITGPIKRLSDASVAVSNGNLETEISICSHNEIGILAENFELMVSRIKKNTRQLEDANQRLFNLDKIKSLFFNSISHQLRTPLFHVVGFSSQIMQDVYNPNYYIEENNRKIIELLDNLNPEEVKKNTKEMIKQLINDARQHVFDERGSFFDLFYHSMMRRGDLLPDDIQTEFNDIMLDSRALFAEYLDNLEVAHKCIDKSGNEMVDMINTFSKISSLDAAVTEVTPKPVNACSLVKSLSSDAQTMLANNEKQESIKLDFRCSDDIEEILIDTFKIKTVLRNLISNAVNFTSNGLITFTIIMENDNNRCNILFTVTDTGMGIREDEYDIIFSEFGRSRDSVHLSGIGLSLALSRRIVELMGGTISFASVYGEGSSFFVRIPEKI